MCYLGFDSLDWKRRLRAPAMVWCWFSLELFLNRRYEGFFLHFKHLFLYSFSLIFSILPLSGARFLKNRLQSSTCIPQMVIVVFNIIEIFVIDHVPDKTNVFIWPYSLPSLWNMLLNLMTKTSLRIYGKMFSKDPFDYPNT